MSLTVTDPSPVASANSQTFGGFSIAPNQPVAVYKPVTLSDMLASSDALERVSSRAAAVLARETSERGKEAQNFVTKLVGSKDFNFVLVGIGIVTALGTAVGLWPNRENFYQPYGGGGAFWHQGSDVPYGFCAAAALAGAAVAGALAGWFSGRGLERAAILEKERMARSQLRLDDVAPVDWMFQAARGQPLERAALGQVARRALTSCEQREVFVSPEVRTLLEQMASETELDQSEAVVAANRHHTFISALRGVERSGGDAGQRVAAFNAAFERLTPAERCALAPDLLKHLFDGAVPRAEDIPFTLAEPMRAKIMTALDAATPEQGT